MKFHNITQNTEDWMKLRMGKVTSSSLSKIMANEGKAFGEPAKKYAVQLAVTQLTGNYEMESYSNEHMERGHEQEPLARMLYEQETFSEVTNGGFFDCGDVGCSPDGLVDDSGVIEIKSVIPTVHFANIKRQNVDPAYKWQCFANLRFTEREWLDFISYCHDFPEGKRLYVYRLHAKDLDDEFNRLRSRLNQFLELIESVKSDINQVEYFNY